MYNEKPDKKKLKSIIKEQKLFNSDKDIVVLGIDQGYANMGYAIVKYNIHRNSYTILNSGTVTTSAKEDIEKRLLIIYKKVIELLETYEIDLISCERLFSNGNRSANGTAMRNKSVAIVRTNMSTGVIYLSGAQYNIKVKDYPPTTVKKQLTGSGKADKEELIEVIDSIVIKQGYKTKTNHESDAIAIGITCICKTIEELLNDN